MGNSGAVMVVPVLHRGVIAVYPGRIEWPGTRASIRSLSWVSVQRSAVTSTLVVVADGHRVDFTLAHADAAGLRDTLSDLILGDCPAAPTLRPPVAIRARTSGYGRATWRCIPTA